MTANESFVKWYLVEMELQGLVELSPNCARNYADCQFHTMNPEVTRWWKSISLHEKIQLTHIPPWQELCP